MWQGVAEIQKYDWKIAGQHGLWQSGGTPQDTTESQEHEMPQTISFRVEGLKHVIVRQGKSTCTIFSQITPRVGQLENIGTDDNLRTALEFAMGSLGHDPRRTFVDGSEYRPANPTHVILYRAYSEDREVYIDCTIAADPAHFFMSQGVGIDILDTRPITTEEIILHSLGYVLNFDKPAEPTRTHDPIVWTEEGFDL